MSGSTARKKAPKKNVPKEALKVTALKKREVTIRAMAIIERMIEEKVEEKWLLDSVHSITQDQYQDVIEERAITKLCGYPLCCDALKDIPSKTYHISTKQNKVYDITDRKNFCSNGCYKASSYLKNQILSSPLWLRDAEERPDYNVLHFREGGSLGAEVDLGHQRVRLADINAPASDATNNDADVPLSEKADGSPQNENHHNSVEESKKVQLKSVNISVNEQDSGGDTPAEKRKTSPRRNISDLNETVAKVKSADEVKSVSDKLESLERTVEAGKSASLINQAPSQRDLKTASLDVSCSAEDSAEISANSESCSVVSKENNIRTSPKSKSDSIVGELKSLRAHSKNVSSSSLTENESNLVSHKLESFKTLSKNESDTRSTKNESEVTSHEIESLKALPENKSGSKVTKRESVVSCELKSLERLSKTEAVKPSSKNASEVCPTEKTTAELSNKINLSDSGKTAAATAQNESSVAPPAEKNADQPKTVSIEEGDSKLAKNASDSKKQSVFKKERHKAKKREDKIDQKAVLLEIVKHIETCLREWVTFDSLIFLFGEESVKKMLEAKGTDFKDCKSLCGTDASTYEKYLSICRKLNMLELDDARADAALKEKNAELRPLPDYSLLKREAKQLEIKVRSFYGGSTRIEMEEEVVKDSKEEDDSSVVLPLVDMHAQKALRRRIVLDRLTVILPDLGRTLNLSIFNLTSAVRNLSQTFSFSSHNITFKPPEWYFIAMVLVKLLSLQDKNMKIMMESGSSEKYLTLLLMNWGLDGGYLDRLVLWLTDIDYLLQKSS